MRRTIIGGRDGGRPGEPRVGRFGAFGCWLGLSLLAITLAAAGCGKSSPPPDSSSNDSSEASSSSDQPAAPAEAKSSEEAKEPEESDKKEETASNEEKTSDGDDQAKPEETSEEKKETASNDENSSEGDSEAKPEAKPKGKKGQRGKKAGAEGIAKEKSPAAPAAPALSDDVTTWKADDYRAAKAARDPRLVDAVAYLGEFLAGDVQAAGLLRELLTIPESPEPQPGPDPPKPKVKPTSSDEEGSEDSGEEDSGDEDSGEEDSGDDSGSDGAGQDDEGSEDSAEEDSSEDSSDEDSSDEESSEDEESSDEEDSGSSSIAAIGTVPPLAPAYLGLNGAIIRALGANGTEAARQTLEQLLAGVIPTGDDRGATCGALKALADNPCLENEAILCRVLTTAEKYRPTTAPAMPMAAAAPMAKGGRGGKVAMPAAPVGIILAEDLRTAVLEVVEESASMRMRVELARYLIGPNPSPSVAGRLAMLIRASHPNNMAAQIGLYRWPNTGAALKRTFEIYFTSYSALAVGRILGMQEPPPQAAGMRRHQRRAGRGGAGVGAAGGVPAAGAPSLFGDAPPINAGPKQQAGGNDENSEEENQDEENQDENSDEENSDENGSDGGGQDDEDNGPSDEPSPEEMPSDEGPRGSRGPQVARGPVEPVNQSVQAFLAVSAGNPSLPFELGQQLWSPRFTPLIQTGLAGANLSENGQMLALASTVPTDAVRAEVYKVLQQHWKEGPAILNSASPVPEVGTKDPGFLVLVKMLPRKPPVVRRTTSARQVQKTPSAEDLAPAEWLRTSYEMAQSYCRRFEATGSSHAQADADAPMPIELPPGTQPTAAFHANWQKLAAGRLGDASVDPLVVHYVRIDETKEYALALGYYNRMLRYGTARERKQESVTWIDEVRDLRGRRCSIDVIIKRNKPAPERQPEQQTGRRSGRRLASAVKLPEPLTIEILTVEINDPAPKTEATPAATAQGG